MYTQRLKQQWLGAGAEVPWKIKYAFSLR